MKVRIDEQGFDKYNGDIGGIEFVDGVSVHELSDREVMRLSASMRVVELESGKQQGTSVTLAESRDLEAEVVEKLPIAEPEPVVEVQKPVVSEEVANLGKYTREGLEAIADKQGVAGLREIANNFEVKGRSIVELVDGILKAQG